MNALKGFGKNFREERFFFYENLVLRRRSRAFASNFCIFRGACVHRVHPQERGFTVIYTMKTLFKDAISVLNLQRK